jgi:ATP-dependent DNA helicase RecQ
MDDALTALRTLFGFEAFRPGQAEAVGAAIADRDALVVMPTGAGKSLCYQLPALMRDDLTIVVSPLVSLMQDQVEALERIAPGRAVLVNAQQDAAVNRAALERALAGEVRLLYIAPERFSSPGFAEALRASRVGLFVVDEAHCVSQWGHDFRPDYFRLADAARWLGARAMMASTATATPQVAADIERRLDLRDAVRVTTGFDRPNLSFTVVACRGAADKRARLAAALAQDGARPAIVYAGTRAETEDLADALAGALGVEVLAYHAGLGRQERADGQRRFMAGEVEVVVATNAFGMGVDKADVRTVAHATVPGSVEAYYQEAGRAGRDGRPARALLFAESRDKGLHVFFIQRAEVDDAAMSAVARALLGAAVEGRYDVSVTAAGDPEPERVRAIAGHLARAGVIHPAPSPVDRLRGRVMASFDGRARAACRSSAGDAQRARWRQYRAVWAFVEGSECRRAAILRHFGDRAAPAPAVPCCDVCAPELVPAGPAPRALPGAAAPGDLDAAIVDVVNVAEPSVGRTRTVEILRGGRSQVVRKNAYDGLPAYGTFSHLRAEEVLARVDELLDEGRLVSTGGAYPKLRLGRAA